MRTQMIIGLALAFGLGVICGVLATLGSISFLHLRDRDPDAETTVYAPSAAVEVANIEVWAARKDIPDGTLIQDPLQFFQPTYYASGTEPVASISSRHQLTNKRTMRPLSANQPVTLDDLADGGIVVPEGLRLIAIRVPDPSGGLILPGSRVDVLVVENQGAEKAKAEVLFENLVVRGINTLNSNVNEQRVSLMLAVRPDQAKVIFAAEATGMLQVALRNPDGAKPRPPEKGIKEGEKD